MIFCTLNAVVLPCIRGNWLCSSFSWQTAITVAGSEGAKLHPRCYPLTELNSVNWEASHQCLTEIHFSLVNGLCVEWISKLKDFTPSTSYSQTRACMHNTPTVERNFITRSVIIGLFENGQTEIRGWKAGLDYRSESRPLMTQFSTELHLKLAAQSSL